MTTIKLKYVRKYIDRHGKLVHQFRRSGFPHQMIKGERGSEAFMAAYHALRAASDTTEQSPAARLTAGSVDAVI
jgi:hypothetical protein